MTKIRNKAPALTVAVPMTRDDCARAITELGNLSRERARVETLMNDELAVIAARFEAPLQALKEAIQSRQMGIQVWCEAHRLELTENGRSKTGHFVTGEVQWRQRPPSVSVRGLPAVLAVLRERCLERFIRVKEDLNKTAILHEPGAVQDVPGLSIQAGIEDFIITPFEQTA